jgi:hypothetical protein
MDEFTKRSEAPCLGFQMKVILPDDEYITMVARYATELNRTVRMMDGQDAGPPFTELEKSDPEKYEGVRAAVRHALYSPYYSGSNPIEQHNAWVYAKLKLGWTYGPREDKNKKTHPCLLPYDELSVIDRFKDVVFGETVQFFRRFMQEKELLRARENSDPFLVEPQG